MKSLLLPSLCLTLFLTGCTSYQNIELPIASKTSPLPFQDGDTIRYRLHDGPWQESRIMTLNHQQFTDTQGKTVMLSHLSSIEKKEISATKTTAAIGIGGLLAITVIIGITAAGLASALAAG
ncbi:TPA: hypothetical protein ACS72K_004013 [Providencia alcalifaciens]